MAMDASDKSAWGTLIQIRRMADGKTEEGRATLLSKDTITIGRMQDCDLAHTNNMLLSGQHCRLLFGAKSGKVFLCDTSKNGTLLNAKRVKNETVEISGDAVIRCVYKKSDPGSDVAYHFKPLNHLAQNEQAIQLKSNTQEYSQGSWEGSESVDDGHRKRRAASNDDEDSAPKMARIDSTCRPKSAEEEKNTTVDNDVELEENLTCGICQDIFYECVSAQPCMHSFCAACFSKWMAKSNECPSCRKVVIQVGRNHIVNNLAAAFLKKHPERHRPKEELTDMDNADQIKNTVVKLKNRQAPPDFDTSDEEDDEDEDDDEDDDYEDDENDDSEEILPFLPHTPAPQIPSILTRVPSVFSRPQTTRCRQCPSFSSASSSSSSSSAASDSFTCSLNQVHIYCSCCQQCFPDRRNTVLSSTQAGNSSAASSNSNMDIQCTSCGRLFCHLYWGCRKSGCLGCLNKFKDFNFGNACLTRILNNNEHESHIFKQLLADKNIDVVELLRICIERLRNKEYTVSSRPNLRDSDIVCFSCGLRYFKELVYQFRAQMPREELPSQVTDRSDCYWGRNCRTQQHNNDHARRYNHICEQTRFV